MTYTSGCLGLHERMEKQPEQSRIRKPHQSWRMSIGRSARTAGSIGSRSCSMGTDSATPICEAAVEAVLVRRESKSVMGFKVLRAIRNRVPSIEVISSQSQSGTSIMYIDTANIQRSQNQWTITPILQTRSFSEPQGVSIWQSEVPMECFDTTSIRNGAK